MKSALRVLVYPLILSAAVAATLAGLTVASEAVVLPIVCAAAAVLVMLLERVIPYETDWGHSHGDVGTDLWHLTLTGALAEAARVALNAGFIVAAVWLAAAVGSSLWPTATPLALQVLLAMTIAEFFGYWLHRWEHRTMLGWRLHSVHHSATRLYWLNAFRTHPLDAIISQTISVAPLIVLGVPPTVLLLYGVITIVHTTMHHSNVDARLGPLNVLLAMAEVHRWHHSRNVHEMSANYGTVLTIWDWVFGTRFLPSDRVIRSVGLDPAHDGYPQTYPGQLKAPFDSAFWRRVAERTDA